MSVAGGGADRDPRMRAVVALARTMLLLERRQEQAKAGAGTAERRPMKRAML